MACRVAAEYILVPTGRQVVATGVSPWKWNTYPRDALSPNGTTGTGDAVFPVAPLGLVACGTHHHHGLTPVATTCRPVGTKIYSAATRQAIAIPAATRRNDVAMGASPWKWNTYPRDALSPNGTTGTGDAVFPVAPLGLVACGTHHYHGLTPVATTCRPVGTESHAAPTRLVAELHAQFAESAKLEPAIKANLRRQGYGG